MKTVVSLQDLLELEIRPEGLFAQYYEQLARDVAHCWAGPVQDAPCPGCGSHDRAPAFHRGPAEYVECRRCGSLFVSPRPDERALVAFYRDAASARFWREQVWPQTAAARLEKIVQPRADWVLDGLAEHAPGATTGLDLSPLGGPLVEALCRDSRRRMIAGGWAADLDAAHAPSPARVQPFTLDTLPLAGAVEFVTAFDVIDRAPDVAVLVDRLAQVIAPGGLLFLTAPNADGFDLQVLWDRAPSLVPPDKLNVLSIEGLQRRFAAPAWELIEVSTPGLFDVEQVRRAVAAAPGAPWPRFVTKLVARDAAAHRDFQEYLQRHRLASFARIVARRPAAS
jgi:SAM-dependent methyltransferase